MVHIPSYINLLKLCLSLVDIQHTSPRLVAVLCDIMELESGSMGSIDLGPLIKTHS